MFAVAFAFRHVLLIISGVCVFIVSVFIVSVFIRQIVDAAVTHSVIGVEMSIVDRFAAIVTSCRATGANLLLVDVVDLYARRTDFLTARFALAHAAATTRTIAYVASFAAVAAVHLPAVVALFQLSVVSIAAFAAFVTRITFPF